MEVAVSFIGFIQLTKSLSCNVAVVNRVTTLFKISRSLVSVRTALSCVQIPFSVQKILTSSALHLSEHQGNTSGCSSVFVKIPAFLCRHGSGKTACNRLKAKATPSGRGLNMDMHEARYGKAVTQFTVQMLYASIWMLAREIRISGDLGFLSL